MICVNEHFRNNKKKKRREFVQKNKQQPRKEGDLVKIQKNKNY